MTQLQYKRFQDRSPAETRTILALHRRENVVLPV
jgi:hypothetical protein